MSRASLPLVLLVIPLLMMSCFSERDDFVPPAEDVYVPPPDATGMDLAELDLAPLPDLGPDGGEDATLADGDEPSDAGDDAGATDADEPADVPPVDVTDPPPAPRACGVTLTYDGLASSVAVAGTFNGWSPTAHPMTEEGGVWTITLEPEADGLAVGGNPYKFVVDGEWIMDPANHRQIFEGEGDCCWNSKLEVPDCRLPLLELESLDADPAAGRVEIWVKVVDGADGEGIDPASVTVTYRGQPFAGATYHAASQRVRILLTGAELGKHSFVVDARNAHGAAEPLFLPVWLEEEPFIWDDAIMYFLFVDRFANGDPSNDGKADCPGAQTWDMADWMGGDWKGALEKLEAGWFDDLGVNTIWITAPMDNPSVCGKGTFEGRWYSSYHGYHPKSQRDPEEHFGTMEELRALVNAAHARGIRVLVDAVINHVHDEHPWASQNPEWFNRPLDGNIASLICGTGCGGNCWDVAPVECWFMDYLPDLDYRQDAVVDLVADDLMWWVREADLDGFRVDAVKHVEESIVRELRAEIEEHAEATGLTFYTVGETFVGGDDGGIALLNRYIGPEMLHGQFDFPLFWDILGAFASTSAPLTTLAARMEKSQEAYGGALMANFLGNHDVPRFMSVARGDIDDANNPPAMPMQGEPGLDELFGKAQLAFAFLMTVPGIPLIYYGDEVGLVGAGDPDNRRMMQFDGFGDPHHSMLLSIVRQLGQARRDNVALRRGNLTILESRDDQIAYARKAPTGEAALVALNRNASVEWQATLDVSGLGWTDGQTLRNPLGGTAVVSGSTVTVSVPPLGSSGIVILVAD